MICKLAVVGAFLAGWAFGEFVRLLWGRALLPVAVVAMLASSGCALLAPVDDHAGPGGGPGEIYYREVDTFVVLGADGAAVDPAVDADGGGEIVRAEAAVDAAAPVDAAPDVRNACRRAPGKRKSYDSCLAARGRLAARHMRSNCACYLQRPYGGGPCFSWLVTLWPS